MCIVSAVQDHYGERFREYWSYFPPYTTTPGTGGPFGPIGPVIDPIPLIPTDPAKLYKDIDKLVEEYRRSLKSAEQLDKDMKQPDCEDPEKAKLTERVEDLERQIKELKKDRKK